MARLEELSVEELDDVLAETPGSKEAQRLLAAIIYKRGPSVPMIADWFGTREATIYRWFDRLEDQPLDQAVRDDPRSGRPSKLSNAQLERFRDAVRSPPSEAGYDQSTWSTKLAQQFLSEEFDVEYTRRHTRRLLDEADVQE